MHSLLEMLLISCKEELRLGTAAYHGMTKEL
jgi:hypothetical protein